MNAARLASIERGLTGTAKKVYGHVAREERDLNRIMTELRTAGTNIGKDLVVGCLKSLVDQGLVQESAQHGTRSIVWWRTYVAAPKVDSELGGLPPVAAAEPPPPPPAPDPLTRLADFAAALRLKGTGLLTAADEVEAIALAIEERRTAELAKLAKLDMFAKFMKELA